MIYGSKNKGGGDVGISIKQAAESWGVKEVTVRKWLRNKELIKRIGLTFKAHKLGAYNYVDFPPEEIKRVKSLLKPRSEWVSGQTIFKKNA